MALFFFLQEPLNLPSAALPVPSTAPTLVDNLSDLFNLTCDLLIIGILLPVYSKYFNHCVFLNFEK
jgi:hypothetical protein